MANESVPKWKRYRDLKRRVNDHVFSVNKTCSLLYTNHAQCQREDVSFSSDKNDLLHEALKQDSDTLGCDGNTDDNFSTDSIITENCEINYSWSHIFQDAEHIFSENSPPVSSSESETDETDESDNLALNLAAWVNKFGVSHSAVNELLYIL